MISDTESLSSKLPSCVFEDPWNAWWCTNEYLGVLLATAKDKDQEDRNVAPMYVTNPGTGYYNKINSYMDHVWDGFYTGQLHKSQFPVLLENQGFYQIEYTGTPFKHMVYKMIAKKGQIKVRALYWDAGSYDIYQGTRKIESNEWNRKIGQAAELTGRKGCGENRFVGGVDNYLEFILTAGCEIEVKPRNSFAANVRMEWTMDQFYAEGGNTRFADRVAGVLGVHSSNVKVMSVYKGSVVVDFVVDQD